MVFTTNKINPSNLRFHPPADPKKLKILTVKNIKSEQTEVIKGICFLCGANDAKVETDSNLISTITSAVSCPDKQALSGLCSTCRDSVVRFYEISNKQSDLQKELDAIVVAIQTVHRTKEPSNEKVTTVRSKSNGTERLQTDLDFINIKSEVEDGQEEFKDGVSGTNTSLILHAEPASELHISQQFLKYHAVANITKNRKRRIGRETFKCYFCSRQQYCIAILETHLQLHTEEIIPLKCPTCGKSFRLKNALKIHISVMHGTEEEKRKLSEIKRLSYLKNTRILSCYFCEREMRLVSLPSHIRQTHTKEIVLHNCEKCQKTFLSAGSLREHKRRVCFLDKKYWESLRKRELAVKARDQANVNCYFCSTKITSKVKLEKHMWRHTFEGQFYECVICKKAFLRKDVLKRHALEGCKEGRTTKPQVSKLAKSCKQCGQLVTSFKGHRFTCGTGVDTRKTCQMCKASFSTVMDKYLHIKMMHGKRKVFKCYFCSNIFLVNSLLGKHMPSHTKEKSFKCKETKCGMFLCSLYALTIHTATKHGASNSKNPFR